MATWADRIGRRVKLRDLHILMEVVRWKSMAKAASQLGVSAPVVSKTITDVERMLDVSLLDRHPDGVGNNTVMAVRSSNEESVFDELATGNKGYRVSG